MDRTDLNWGVWQLAVNSNQSIYNWRSQDFLPLTTVFSPLGSSLWSMDSKWVTGGQIVMYHNWNADGRELCLSHHSLLTHRLACQPSQRKLSQHTSQFGKPPCCLKSNCSMWWILQSVSSWDRNNKLMKFKLCSFLLEHLIFAISGFLCLE